MRPTNKEIIEALEIIKKTCKESEDCFVCPLRDISEPQHCKVSRDYDNCPCVWVINTSEEWIALH